MMLKLLTMSDKSIKFLLIAVPCNLW